MRVLASEAGFLTAGGYPCQPDFSVCQAPDGAPVRGSSRHASTAYFDSFTLENLFFRLSSIVFLRVWIPLLVACKVMAGLLHFLIIASFMWMFLEALQLFLLVRMLSKVQVIQRDGLPTPVLYLVGYGTPFVIVGASALVFSEGYGATDAKV
ncbi:hypothetical protein CRUP_013437 [Coryphaenoides rupestris]|nr:hypothetical protein CRUP_013437 [Coryphaenoides rupestris]